MTDAVTLLTKLWPQGIPAEEYAKAVTIARELGPTTAPVRAVTPAAAPSKKSGRPPGRPPKAAQTSSGVSRAETLRRLFADGPRTLTEIKDAVGNPPGLHSSLAQIGASLVSSGDNGEPLYGLSARAVAQD